MTIQEMNSTDHIFGLERTQLLTIPAMSVKKHQFAGYLLTGHRSNFLRRST